MKISIKPFEDYYKKFREVNIDMKSFKKRYKNICYKNHKVIHHDHKKRENNIIDYICNNCNLKIKNKIKKNWLCYFILRNHMTINIC